MSKFTITMEVGLPDLDPQRIDKLLFDVHTALVVSPKQEYAELICNEGALKERYQAAGLTEEMIKRAFEASRASQKRTETVLSALWDSRKVTTAVPPPEGVPSWDAK